MTYEEYAKSLGFKKFEDYEDWCFSHSFPVFRGKTDRQFKREQEILKDERFLSSLQRAKESPNLRKAIEILRDTEKAEKNGIIHLIQLYFSNNFKSRNAIAKRVFFEFLLHLEKNSKLLVTNAHTQMVLSVACKCEHWIRPIEGWVPKTHNKDRQFSSLIRYLFTDYKLPAFMDNAWVKEDIGSSQSWFIHVASGKNIRTAKNLPFPLTKKMAHNFLSAPKNCTMSEALRWGQITAIGGDERLFRALRETKIMRGGRLDHEFYMSIYRFFISNPMLDTAQINPIIDYIWSKKYDHRRDVNDLGVIENKPPEQPNFSMQGRTVDTLLDQVNRWHRQLGKETKGGQKLVWDHSAIKDFSFEEGSPEGKNQKIWSVHQLLSSQELSIEGRAHRHCVAYYGHSCSRGSVSIWSMGLSDKTGFNRCVTIEVTGGRVAQVRGKNNRLATVKEKQIINRWATREGLTISSMYGW